jgi:hypothetical protein
MNAAIWDPNGFSEKTPLPSVEHKPFRPVFRRSRGGWSFRQSVVTMRLTGFRSSGANDVANGAARLRRRLACVAGIERGCDYLALCFVHREKINGTGQNAFGVLYGVTIGLEHSDDIELLTDD